MTIMILERVPPSLRGELTRWLLEPKTGVFVGNVSALVRGRLWQKACHSAGERGACMLIYRTNNEQGFLFDFWGETSRHVHEWDGLQLVTRPH